MNLLEAIMNANGGQAVNQVGRQVGLSPAATEAAVAALLPLMQRGFQRNTAEQSGLDALLGALQTGNHERYVEQPAVLAQPESVNDGNGILGHLFGSKDVSRNVAGVASQQTGIDPALLKKLLPLLAPIVMGVLSKQLLGGGGRGVMPAASAAPAPSPAGGGVMGMLGGLLDSNQDGSIADDVLNLAKRFF